MNLILKWLVLTVVILFIAWIIPGISIDSFLSAIIAAAVISLINIFLKPILNYITLPINTITLGIFSLVLNTLLLLLVSFVVPGFNIDSFLAAFLGTILLSLFSIGLNFI